MGLFGKLLGGGAKDAGEGVSAVLEGTGKFAKDLREAITGDISAEKKAELALKAQEIENEVMLAQAKINEAEAKSSNFFIAGARPATIWLANLGLFYYFIFRPIFYDLFLKYFHFELQQIDGGTLMNLVVAVLGLGAYRTYEKAKGVQDRH